MVIDFTPAAQPIESVTSLHTHAKLRRAGAVLVVEDDADVRGALAELLRDEGYDVLLASNGQEALDVLGRETPSLLLIDLLMPVMGGIELLKRLRREPAHACIPMVVMTGVNDAMIGVKLDLPVLQKPIDAQSLIQILATYCRPA